MYLNYNQTRLWSRRKNNIEANVGDKKNFLIRSTKKDTPPPPTRKKQQTKSVSVMAKQKKNAFSDYYNQKKEMRKMSQSQLIKKSNTALTT